MNVNSVLSSSADLNEVLNEANLAQRGKRTLKYGKEFVLAVIFSNFMHMTTV